MDSVVKRFWIKYKRYIIALALCIWATILVFALRTNPSAQEAKAKLVIMEADMDAAMQNGGKIIRSQSISKYGGALVSRLLSDEGWSIALMHKYQYTLVDRGWNAVGNTNLFYCKGGILAEFKPNSGVVDGIGTNYISMVYDPFTIRKCSK